MWTWLIVLLIEVSVLFTRNCDISRTLWRGLMHKTTNGFRNKCSKPADVERIACLSSYSHLLFIDFDFPLPYFLKLGIKKFTHGTEKLFRLSGQKILRPGSNFESCLVCVFVIGLIIFIYLSWCYPLTTHESGDGRTVGGVSVNIKMKIFYN